MAGLLDDFGHVLGVLFAERMRELTLFARRRATRNPRACPSGTAHAS